MKKCKICDKKIGSSPMGSKVHEKCFQEMLKGKLIGKKRY